MPVKARRTEDPPLKDDKQYFIEPVLPNKIEHALQEESRAMGEDSISFETRETNEEQLRETMDRVNIKTPNVVGSSTQPLEGVERVELVAGDNGKIEASKEEVVQKVTLKTRKEKGSENTKTASQKEEGIEKVTLKSTKQKENQKDICSEDSSSALLKPGGEKKVGETRESKVLNSDSGKTNADNLIEPEEQSNKNRKSQIQKNKKETKQIQKESVTKDSASDVKRKVVKDEKTAPSSSPPSSSSSNDSEKKVEPKKKLSHSTSREEDKIQIKIPETKRREIDTSQKTAPIQKDDSTELKYVVEEPNEEREKDSEQKKKQLDVIEMFDDQPGVSEKMPSFTVQEPETPDSPEIRKTESPEELGPRKEQTPSKGKLQPKIAEEKSVIQQTASQTQAETEASKSSRGYKAEHIKTKPQEREVARLGFGECRLPPLTKTN